jgi:predicted acyltransferase
MSERLTSLDAFRGATMAFMVLVNNPGNGDTTYGPLLHAHWDGWTPTDVVFPSFVWITGLAMTLSLGKKLAQGVSKSAIFKQVLRRALILFALGVLVYSLPVPDLGTFRILGVLQRIAICYLCAAAIYLNTGVRGQIRWVIGLLAVYWALMVFGPVPNYGSGHLDVERNFAHYVDKIVLGSHNYANTKTWDPEGIVSTLPSIATCLLGILAGHIIALPWTVGLRALAMASSGALLIVLALFLDQVLPINKSIWTSSFALFMAGLDCLILPVFMWIADGLGKDFWFKPFIWIGLNPITIYMSSELLDIFLQKTPMGAASLRVVLYQSVFLPLASVPENASLLYALAFTLLHVLIAWVLYKRGWFIRI